MERWQTKADLSQDSQICVLQIYSEGHSSAALQQPSSFKFDNNSFMQNMSQSGASRMENGGCFIFLHIGSLKPKYNMAYNDMKSELMELITEKIFLVWNQLSFFLHCKQDSGLLIYISVILEL